MRRGKQEFSLKDEPTRPPRQDVAAEPVWQGNRLSPEFCELIYEWDPEAANDSYSVTSADFGQLHSQIKKDLLRGVLLWAISLSISTAGLILIFG